jgi:hypothetical protein
MFLKFCQIWYRYCSFFHPASWFAAAKIRDFSHLNNGHWVRLHSRDREVIIVSVLLIRGMRIELQFRIALRTPSVCLFHANQIRAPPQSCTSRSTKLSDNHHFPLILPDYIIYILQHEFRSGHSAGDRPGVLRSPHLGPLRLLSV